MKERPGTDRKGWGERAARDLPDGGRAYVISLIGFPEERGRICISPPDDPLSISNSY